MSAAELAGVDLGDRVVAYDARDAILFALAAGAPPDRLDLVYERRLRPLPTLANALALWAVEAAGALGAYDPQRALHASQSLRVHRPLHPADEIATHGRVGAVWDKGKAAVAEVLVESEAFTVTSSLYLPGHGGWNGERGPSARTATLSPSWRATFTTRPDQAALYRLTGDRHPVHVDPAVASASGFERPILHGLCTLAIAAREVASAVGAHPAELVALEARFTAPVTPGETLSLAAECVTDGDAAFEARVGERVVIGGGRATFRA